MTLPVLSLVEAGLLVFASGLFVGVYLGIKLEVRRIAGHIRAERQIVEWTRGSARFKALVEKVISLAYPARDAGSIPAERFTRRF